jgi:hypothetical protein
VGLSLKGVMGRPLGHFKRHWDFHWEMQWNSLGLALGLPLGLPLDEALGDQGWEIRVALGPPLVLE